MSRIKVAFSTSRVTSAQNGMTSPSFLLTSLWCRWANDDVIALWVYEISVSMLMMASDWPFSVFMSFSCRRRLSGHRSSAMWELSSQDLFDVLWLFNDTALLNLTIIIFDCIQPMAILKFGIGCLQSGPSIITFLVGFFCERMYRIIIPVFISFIAKMTKLSDSLVQSDYK